jgi:hypothetical protein
MACKSAAVHLALLAMLLRAVLPAGWMPAAIGNADASPFVICTMDGPLHSTPAKPPHDHDRATSPCVFASAAPLSSPDAAIVTPTPAQQVMQIAFVPLQEAIVATPYFRPNTARAPPAFA